MIRGSLMNVIRPHRSRESLPDRIDHINYSRYVKNNPVNAVDPSGLALVAFDGTGNHPALSTTNIWFIKQAYERAGGHVIYVAGVGTTSEVEEDVATAGAMTLPIVGPWVLGFELLAPDAGDVDMHRAIWETGEAIDFGQTARAARGSMVTASLAGNTSGLGISRRLNDAYAHLDVYLADNPNDREIDITGFSRGAVTARAFANKIQPLLEKYPGARLRSIGVFDSVASIGDDAMFGEEDPRLRGLNTDLPVGMNEENAFHALAMHENRKEFPLLRYKGANQVWFAGAHSDDGGGYAPAERGLSTISLGWMMHQMKEAGVPLAYDDSDFAVLPSYLVMHDELKGAPMKYDEQHRVIERGDKVHGSVPWAYYTSLGATARQPNSNSNATFDAGWWRSWNSRLMKGWTSEVFVPKPGTTRSLIPEDVILVTPDPFFQRQTQLLNAR